MYYNRLVLWHNHVSGVCGPDGTTNNFEYIVNVGKRIYYVAKFGKRNLKLWQNN